MPTFRHLRALDEKLAEYRRGKVDSVTKIFWDLNYETIVKKAIAISTENNSVLDVGCGTGNYLIVLSRKGRICYGADPSRDVSLKPAKERAFKEKVSVFLCQGVGEFLPFKTGSFDVVLFISTLQHVGDQNLAIREIRRSLKDRGLLLVSVPTIKNISTLFREVELPNYFTKGFEIRNFQKVLVESGFRILNIEGSGFFPPFTSRLLHISRYLLGEKATREIMRILNVFANVWLSSASNLIASCQKED